MYSPVVLAQIEAERSINHNGIWSLILDADPVVKIVLIVLVACSIVSWAIIFYKYQQVKKAQAESQTFWNTFSQTKSLKDLAEGQSRSGPLSAIFLSSVDQILRLKKGVKTHPTGRESLVQKMAQAREEEIYKLEQYTPFLATTASTAPFIGLFGTVWGILMAFWAIGKAGSSSLATVGPYISESLVATAMGLAAAIPAVVAYNHFVHRIKVLVKMMDLFADDLMLKIEEEVLS